MRVRPLSAASVLAAIGLGLGALPAIACLSAANGPALRPRGIGLVRLGDSKRG